MKTSFIARKISPISGIQVKYISTRDSSFFKWKTENQVDKF